jgi:hypothetical protein
MLSRFIYSPWVNLFSGVVLLITSGYETWVSIDQYTLAVHHGILIFSLVHIIKALPDVLHGAKDIHAQIKTS